MPKGRRSFIANAGTISAGMVLMPMSKFFPSSVTFDRTYPVARHMAATVVSSASLPIESGKRAPFGWELTVVSGKDQKPVVLVWPDLDVREGAGCFRVCVGIDERDSKVLECYLPDSEKRVGLMDLKFVSQFQLYELEVSKENLAEIGRQGLALRLLSGSDFEIITGGADVPEPFLPHLMYRGKGDPMSEYFLRMNSLACVQPFGWMEGCVLEGLMALGGCPGYEQMLVSAKNHVDHFMIRGDLIYEDPKSKPVKNEIYGAEGGLPFGAIAQFYPESPLLDVAVEQWQSWKDDEGMIYGGGITTEGAYTIAYPLAEIARVKQSPELMQLALAQLDGRLARLFDGKIFYRGVRKNGERFDAMWSRGIAWQLLGMARSMEVAKEMVDISNMIRDFQQVVKWAMTFQRRDGLWSIYLNESDTLPDTGGSAGIAAAMAIGVKNGWLERSDVRVPRKALKGLKKYLTDDGFMGGVSQSNKGGVSLQRGDFRALYQIGMGLFGILFANLEIIRLKN